MGHHHHDSWVTWLSLAGTPAPMGHLALPCRHPCPWLITIVNSHIKRPGKSPREPSTVQQPAWSVSIAGTYPPPHTHTLRTGIKLELRNTRTRSYHYTPRHKNTHANTFKIIMVLLPLAGCMVSAWYQVMLRWHPGDAGIHLQWSVHGAAGLWVSTTVANTLRPCLGTAGSWGVLEEEEKGPHY